MITRAELSILFQKIVLQSVNRLGNFSSGGLLIGKIKSYFLELTVILANDSPRKSRLLRERD